MMPEASAHALQCSLRRITETLAHGLAQESAIVPAWSEFEWNLAPAVAAMHGVSALLARKLSWKGPASWSEFLSEQRLHTRARYARIEELLNRMDQCARTAGLTVLPLKGVALHALGIYAPGERPMADVDLLIRPADSEQTRQMIMGLGFYEARVSFRERLFLPLERHAPTGFAEHANNDIKIELHERICEPLPLRLVDVSKRVFPMNSRPGINSYPSLAALMLHLLLHAAGALTLQALRLIHTHDLAALAQRMSGTDWEELLRSDEEGSWLWWAFPPLRLVSVYYPGRVPSHVLSALARSCPWTLSRAARRQVLSDVSFSQLWVKAFPGIAWCRSAGEMLTYIASRVRPSARHLALRNATVPDDMWTAANNWQQTPQCRRIWRWIVSRQPRSATMYVVKAALNKI